MSHDQKVLTDPELFAQLIERLSDADKSAFQGTRHGRVETASPGKQLVVYHMQGRQPKVLAKISIIDLSIDEDGASTEIIDVGTRERLVVGYSPCRLFDFPVFLSLPSNLAVRWRVASEGGKGFLAWPVYMRTQSRRHLREVGVTYCETLRSFHEEFAAEIG